MIINNKSTIAILGGAGKAGRPLVTETLAAGYRVRLLLRHPKDFDVLNERLEIVDGDARDPVSIRKLLQGSDALLSTLGHTKGESTPMMSTATINFIEGMQAVGITRCIVVTSLFSTGYEQLDPKTQEAANYMQQHYPLFMNDRQLEFKLLRESNLDWTYVRVPYITQESARGGVDINVNHLPGQQITATDLAHFLIHQLDDRRYIRQAPFVASKQQE